MKKIFTMIAVVAFLAACGGNPNKKAQVAEEVATEQVAATEKCPDTCCESEAECTAEKKAACCEAAAETTPAATVAE